MSAFYTLSDSVVSDIKFVSNKLWEIINSSPSYSFVKEPLPVFFLLLARYANQDVIISEDKVNRYVTNLSFEYGSDRDDLLNNFPDTCEKVLIREKDVFERFFDFITNECYDAQENKGIGVITHGYYKYLHRELVEFFISKYSEYSDFECVYPSKILNDLWRICADDNEHSYLDNTAVYVPFSGLASYFLNAEEDNTSFMNHCYNEEPNENLSFIAKVRLNAWGYPSRIASHANPVNNMESDPLKQWGWATNWAMVSIPPFGLKVKQEDEYGNVNEIDVAEFLINRFLKDEKINSAYLVLPLSFCYSSLFTNLRKMIVDNKYLCEVIEIPAKSFKTTTIATVIISLKKYGYDTVSFGHLDKRDDKGNLDLHETSIQSIVDNSYLIAPSLYNDEELVLKDGQTAMTLGELVDIMEPIKESIGGEVCILKDSDFINSTDELFVERIQQYDLPGDNMKIYSGKCLVIKKRLNGVPICPIEGTFATSADSLVLSLKENASISMTYLAYCMLNSEKINVISSYGARLSSSLVQLMLNVKLPILLSANKQNALMKSFKDEFILREEREFRKEMERYGIRAASSDLNHILGPTHLEIKRVLNQLDKDGKGHSEIESIRGNVAYMFRMIKYAGIDFNNYKPALSEIGIYDFLNEHLEACKNRYITTFEIDYVNFIDNYSTFMIDVDMFKYLLDTILDNVYKHGFEQKEVPGAMVRISSSPTLIDEKPYLLISIANNGKPFAEDFTIEKFIGRGECCGNTKNTGLGGYHTYHIIKKHDGFLNLTGTSAWPVIYEILLPIEDSFEDNAKLSDYENRTNCI
jgi:type I restriction enzyme M protein